MKYIKLFEGFESDILSKTISFLKKKEDLSKVNLNKFISDIKNLAVIDFPVSRIKDTDIEYIKKSKAVKIRNTDNVLNEYGIYCIKYWFSMDGGYLGYTGTGNKTSDYEEIKKSITSVNDAYRPKIFNNEQLKYIYEKMGIKTGVIKPVSDYGSLNTGDDILFVFGSRFNKYRSGIVLGKAFIQEDGYVFALHNVEGRNGQRPSGTRTERDLADSFGFDSSWSFGHIRSVADDHCLLHTYIDDGEPLRYIVDGKEIEVDFSEPVKTENYLDFNLPCTYERLYNWTEDNIRKSSIVEESDFAIVLYLDNILSKIDKKSKISLDRRKNRLGASFLSSNSSVKDENIDRYLNKIFSQHGIDTKKQELVKLEKLVNTILCGKFLIIDIFNDSYTFENIKRLGDLVKNLIEGSLTGKEETDSEVEYRFSKLLNFYKDKRTNSIKRINKYSSNLIKIQNSGNTDIIEIFKEVIRIGDKITKYIKESKIESLEDIRMMYFKLNSIYGVFSDRNFLLSNSIIDLINRFEYSGLDASNLDYVNLVDDKKKLKLIENYIDSILK
jgi:hypothetical protein